MIAFGLVLTLVGVLTTLAGVSGAVPGVPAGAILTLGVGLLLVGLAVAAASSYKRTSANEALVRTGQGRATVALNSGLLVFPVVHEVVRVSLETMKLEVERVSHDALITQDNLRVDVKAEFYIRVNPTNDDILQAARSLGNKSTQGTGVSDLVFEKLVSALRSVAAQNELSQIHSDRKGFAGAVQELVAEELQQNGLLLETVTISRLDQTDPRNLSDENIFDAQGKRKITEITASARVERNRLERMAEQQITQQDVETRQRVLQLEREREAALADQQRDVANVKAEREREKEAFAVAQRQAVREAEIQSELAVESANIGRERNLILRRQEQEQTDIERTKTLELAERLKQIAIAEQEAVRALKERDALAAQAEREQANQQIVTVQATAQADREAQTKLIAAKQVIEQDRIKRQTDAEVSAFAEIKDAEASQKAATLQAQARLMLAEAEANSRKAEASGDQAQRLVEVNVERQKVEVEEARVEVERRALENRQTYDRAAIEFETTKFRIEADKEVQIALANALGAFMSRGNYNIYGDPNTMSEMFGQFSKGMGMSARMDGVLQSLPQPIQDALAQLGPQATDVLQEFLRQRSGNGHHTASAAVTDDVAHTQEGDGA